MKLKINGNLIEGDAEDLKNLIFSSNGAGQTKKDSEEKAQDESPEPIFLSGALEKKVTVWRKHKDKKDRPLKRGKYHISAETAKKRREFLIAFNARAKSLAKSEGISFREAMQRLGKKGKSGKFCVFCNKPVPRYKQRYCSSECAKKGQLASIKKWQKNHKEQHNKYRNIARAKKKGEEGKVPTYLKKDKSEQRRVWIQSRAKSLEKTYQLGYEKALEQARAEWDYKLKKKQPTKPVQVGLDEFPSFDRISGNSLSILESMFRHMIGTSGRLNYFTTSQTISLDQGINWTGRIWHDFVAEAVFKSQKITDYFNVKGQLKVVTDQRGYEILEYTK